MTKKHKPGVKKGQGRRRPMGKLPPGTGRPPKAVRRKGGLIRDEPSEHGPKSMNDTLRTRRTRGLDFSDAGAPLRRGGISFVKAETPYNFSEELRKHIWDDSIGILDTNGTGAGPQMVQPIQLPNDEGQSDVSTASVDEQNGSESEGRDSSGFSEADSVVLDDSLVGELAQASLHKAEHARLSDDEPSFEEEITFKPRDTDKPNKKKSVTIVDDPIDLELSGAPREHETTENYVSLVSEGDKTIEKAETSGELLDLMAKGDSEDGTEEFSGPFLRTALGGGEISFGTDSDSSDDREAQIEAQMEDFENLEALMDGSASESDEGDSAESESEDVQLASSEGLSDSDMEIEEAFDMDESELLQETELDEIITAMSESRHAHQQKSRKDKAIERDLMSADFSVYDYDSDDIGGWGKKGKKKARKGKVPAGLQTSLDDETTELQLREQWASDREKKKWRKQEREAMRELGMLGKRKSKAQKKQSHQFGYDTTVNALQREIHRFVKQVQMQQLELPPMDNRSRKSVHELSAAYQLKSKSMGKGVSRRPVLYKTARTSLAGVDQGLVEAILQGNPVRFWRSKNTGQKTKTMTFRGGRLHEGQVVGDGAPEIGIENRGRAMLEKLGWSHGSGLGSVHNKGMHEPIAAVVKTTKSGLG